MSLVLYVRFPLILAAKLVGLFFTITLKKKKSTHTVVTYVSGILEVSLVDYISKKGVHMVV